MHAYDFLHRSPNPFDRLHSLRPAGQGLPLDFAGHSLGWWLDVGAAQWINARIFPDLQIYNVEHLCCRRSICCYSAIDFGGWSENKLKLSFCYWASSSLNLWTKLNSPKSLYFPKIIQLRLWKFAGGCNTMQRLHPNAIMVTVTLQ